MKKAYALILSTLVLVGSVPAVTWAESEENLNEQNLDMQNVGFTDTGSQSATDESYTTENSMESEVEEDFVFDVSDENEELEATDFDSMNIEQPEDLPEEEAPGYDQSKTNEAEAVCETSVSVAYVSNSDGGEIVNVDDGINGGVLEETVVSNSESDIPIQAGEIAETSEYSMQGIENTSVIVLETEENTVYDNSDPEQKMDSMEEESEVIEESEETNEEYESAYTGWNNIDGEWYFYNDEGTLLTNGWAEDDSGWHWMNECGKIARETWIQSGTDWYYLDCDGYRVTGEYLINGLNYRFRDDGTMYTGWYHEYNTWHYYKSNGKPASAEWLKIGEQWYYFNQFGFMAENEWTKDSNGWYWMDTSGKITKNKWILYEDEWYYMTSSGLKAVNTWAKDNIGWCWMDGNGKITRGKWILNSGEWYYLKFDGYMAANEWAEDSKGLLWMDAGGKITKNKWIKTLISGSSDYYAWYYLKSNGRCAVNEWLLYGGKWYYFDGGSTMVTGEQCINGSYYRFADNGVMVIGWYHDTEYTNDFWYYYKTNGKRASDEWIKDHEKWYYIWSYMVTGEWCIDGSWYRFGNNGVMITGWYYDSVLNEWNYYKSNGKCAADEWQKINGKWFYFSGHCMLCNGIWLIGGKGYEFDKNGVMMHENAVGWLKKTDANSKDPIWYYVNKGGSLATGWQKINGKWYYFNESFCNLYVINCPNPQHIGNKVYVFDKNGALLGAEGGWIYPFGEYGSKYYANKGGSLVSGWKNIDGKWYYFDTNHFLTYHSGTYTINNKNYTFDYDGVWIG